MRPPDDPVPVRLRAIMLHMAKRGGVQWRHRFAYLWIAAAAVQLFPLGAVSPEEPAWFDGLVVGFLLLAIAALVGALADYPWRYRLAKSACLIAIGLSVADAFLAPVIGYLEAALWVGVLVAVRRIAVRDPQPTDDRDAS